MKELVFNTLRDNIKAAHADMSEPDNRPVWNDAATPVRGDKPREWLNGRTWNQRAKELVALDPETVSLEDINAVLGEAHAVELPKCDDCGNAVEGVMLFEIEVPDSSAEFYYYAICRDCLKKRAEAAWPEGK